VWSTLQDTDEVSFFYVQYYQMLCDYQPENTDHIMLLSEPTEAQAKSIGAFSEFQVALVTQSFVKVVILQECSENCKEYFERSVARFSSLL
jgi:hypothetical protein